MYINSLVVGRAVISRYMFKALHEHTFADMFRIGGRDMYVEGVSGLTRSVMLPIYSSDVYIHVQLCILWPENEAIEIHDADS